MKGCSKHFTLLLLLIFQGSSVLLFSAQDEKDFIQQKSKETPFGKHSLLTADLVELEFKMDPTNVDRVSGSNSNIERISQQMGVGSLWKLGPASQLSHQFLIGVKQESFGEDPVFGQQENQRYQQRQVTTFTTKPAEPFKLNLANEVINERNSESEKDTQILKQGASLEYAMPFGVGLRPEVTHETLRDELSQETDRNSAYLALKKDLVKDRLNMQIKPGVAREDQLYTGGLTSEAGKLDLSLTWKPDASTEWIWGTQTQQTERFEEMSNEEMRGLYSQVNYRLWSDLAFRMRGDVQSTQKIMDGAGLTSNESNMNLNFGPNMALSETFSAGAELGFHSRYDHINSSQTNEQTLSISFKGSF